ncbi:MAG: RNA polymerase sigma factor [Oscillospiraceae bacterium]
MVDVSFSIIADEVQRNELQIFYTENYKRFIYLAMQKVKNKENAEDVIQEVFSDIADKPEIFFNIPKIERVTFADILVRNTAISTFKKERNRTNKLQELDEEMVDESVRIEDDLLAKVTRNELIKYILTLPEQQRTVYKLRIITGMSISDIAKQLEISCETVNWHLKMARKNIRNFIEKGINGNE